MCLYPRYIVDLPSGKKFYSATEYSILKNIFPDAQPIPCGKCLECCQQYSNEWSFRIMDEAEKYQNNCCVTLTYNDENLPEDLNVNKRDYQLFLKLLRLKIGKLRYFGCAEYGGKYYRPHYHIILFGVKFDDMYYWSKSKSGQDLYRSPLLESCWKNGYSYIGQLDIRTAKYCAKYLQKFAITHILELQSRVSPFTFMSTHPGIGGSFEKCLSTDKLYKAGKWVKTPRYYLKQAESQGYDLGLLKSNRKAKSVFFERDLSQLKKLRKKSENLLTFVP